MFPDYGAVVIQGVQGVEEFAEVPDPAGYLFPFDIGEGIGSLGDVRLVCGYGPIETEVELEFIEKVVC